MLSLAGVLLLQVFYCYQCHGQANLIPNADFEKLNLIRFPPTFIDGQLYAGLRYDTSFLWRLGTKESGVCSQFLNWQQQDTCLADNARYEPEKAYSGNVYAYFSTNINRISGNAYFKDIGLTFNESLQAGSEYEFCCFANFENVNMNDLNKIICVNLSDTIVDLNFEHDLKPHISEATRKPRELSIFLNSSIYCHSFNIPVNRNGYQRICLRFTAKGGEKHLILGNLKRFVQCRYKKNMEKDRFATSILFKSDIGDIYIDNCSLIKLNSPVDSEPIAFPDERIKNIPIEVSLEPHLLASIYFDHGSSEITDQLNLERAIREAQKWNLKNCDFLIVGHTDGTGNSALNTVLSQNRARVVTQKILEKIPDANVTYKGGPVPVESSLTDATLRRADIYLTNCK